MKTILQLVLTLCFSSTLIADSYMDDRLPYLGMGTWEVYGRDGVKINKDMQKHLTINTTNGYGSYTTDKGAILNVSPRENGKKVYSLSITNSSREHLFRFYEVEHDGKVIQYSECKIDQDCKTATPEICSIVQKAPLNRLVECSSLNKTVNELNSLMLAQSTDVYAKLSTEAAQVKLIQPKGTKTIKPTIDLLVSSRNVSEYPFDHLSFLKNICNLHFKYVDQDPQGKSTKNQSKVDGATKQ